MKRNHPLRKMLIVSTVIHIIFFILTILVYVFTPEVEIVSLAEDQAQFVALYELTELPDNLPRPEPEPRVQEPPSQDSIAFRTISTIISQPTSAPTFPPTPTPTPLILPTPTPTPTKSVPAPTPRPTPRPSLPPRQQQQERQEEVVVVEVPKRRPIIQYTPEAKDARDSLSATQHATPPQRTSSLPGIGTGPGLNPDSQRSSNLPSVTLDQADAFPYPEYLAYIEEKIAGLWFPQGSGTVSLFLIIERNGKILKSGVDKGEGIGVRKLRESIIRAIGMITRFDPLPQEYGGMVLRIRITVRR